MTPSSPMPEPRETPTMSDRQPCCKRMWRGFHDYACGKTAKVERDGKWYCTIHDPQRRAEKDAFRQAKWERKAAIAAANRDINAARNAAADLIERGDVTKAEFAAAQDAIKLARQRLADLESAP